MANAEHLAILRRSVGKWNTWRTEHPEIVADLRHADLYGANLTEAKFQDVDLQGAKFQEADLYGANLQRADLSGANFTEAILYGADLSGAKLQRADFSGSNLELAILELSQLQEADLGKANLRGARLERVNLTRARLEGVNLELAKLQGADIFRANLTGAILKWANLTEANLTEANLTETNLQGAILEQTKLQGADLRGANLVGANLTGAILRGVNLTRANLTRANLTGADLMNAYVGFTVFGNLNLSAVRGLHTLGHGLPSTIGIDTLYRSQGQIPEAFLRGCGVPDSMIEYARALVIAERPIDYYSVFISYSSIDEAIAQRLHADLQARGVRCWFAPHDLEIGAPIVRGIDEAIRIYDKLLIILSEAAVTSRWVDFEVSTALHREVEQGRTMLFPIRLDDTVLHTPSGWAAQLRTRHIGDFRSWKEHDRYQAAFTRLLRDLKAKDQAGT